MPEVHVTHALFSALVASLPHTGHLLVYGVVGASGLWPRTAQSAAWPPPRA